ncbi:hypothetical protein CUT44_11730 [Streptomyces carminius]|uniref:Lipoprotein n=1 Tax=Streptomyces carminius TaxID=2665496 RepID=A0A2M8M0R2_9ACTN|nr:hypothetical protein [Streptomyces carminius]PJE97071.1 hypothetical protein CUT44_14985 [Streptomyces carminius]PJE97780.1 hypothetical protein CUT44_11730 [Streptomyces carminius]
MKTRVHAVAGVLALALISLFFTASAVVEIFGDDAAVRAVKTAVVFALFVLVPCMAITGATGRSLGAPRRRAPLIRRKQRRMAAAAAIGLLVLVPCAITLRIFADDGRFDTTFAVVQAVEFLGGAVNITLLGLSARDGRLLTAAARRRKRQAATVAVQP